LKQEAAEKKKAEELHGKTMCVSSMQPLTTSSQSPPKLIPEERETKKVKVFFKPFSTSFVHRNPTEECNLA
jgi:hypothetical protein